MGIVSLPGMMTGQMLGGAIPMTAITYQIAIMICILSAMVSASTINLFILRKISFNNQGMLKEVFLK
jgi:putative ABC transport system permease protein